MSLAADTARTSSNWNAALTLNWFIGVLENSKAQGRQGMSLDTALDMINDYLSSLEGERRQTLNDERVRREIENGNLQEVFT